MLRDVLHKIFTSRNRKLNWFNKRAYIENKIRDQWVELCKEFNINPIQCPLVFSDTKHLLDDANTMRAAKGIGKRNEITLSAFFVTMHVGMPVNGRMHNELIGIICNMTNILSKFEHDFTTEEIDRKIPLLRTLIKHEIGHVIVEGSVYEGKTMTAMELLIKEICSVEIQTLSKLKGINDDYEFAKGYYQLKRESMANEAVGISLEEICNTYAMLNT